MRHNAIELLLKMKKRGTIEISKMPRKVPKSYGMSRGMILFYTINIL